MAVLARELVGAEPTSRSATEWRFGSKDSLSVVVAGGGRGNWYDHEAGRGGDALGLVAQLRRTSVRDALAWAMEPWPSGAGRTRNPPQPYLPKRAG